MEKKHSYVVHLGQAACIKSLSVTVRMNKMNQIKFN